MSDAVVPVAPGERLRIAVLGDFDGVHTRSWLRWFIERGHDVHAISFYPPREPLDGVTLHVLRQRTPATASGGGGGAARLPRGLVRLAHGLRYRRAGLARVVREIAPDVLHAHFVVEHGFYGALTGFHPYVVTAWGSDVLVEPERDRVSRLIARWTLARGDLVTSNNTYMAGRIVARGVAPAKVAVVTLGADRYFMEAGAHSVNLRDNAPGPAAGRPYVVLSTRAHEPLYNMDVVVDSFAIVAARVPEARLVIVHGGSQTEALRARAAPLGGRVTFAGFLEREALRDALTEAEVFVSVPSSDASSVALLQAMAAGCFPVVSDLPSQREWVDDAANGFRVAARDPLTLAERIVAALTDAPLRRRAADINARIVEERGLNETQMAKMEALYRGLARYPSS